MLYTYECPDHGEFDVILKLAEMTPTYKCPECRKKGKRVLVPGSGGVFLDEQPSWLASACETLLRPEDKPLTTRGEYKKYLKDNGVFERG